MAGVGPDAGLREGSVQDVAGEGADHSGVFGEGDELVGQDQAVIGVLPTHQGLGANDIAGAEADLGLVVHDELASFQCAAVSYLN